MRLMNEHFKEGRHGGSAWKVIIPVLLIVFMIIAALIWLTYKLLASLF